MRRRLLSYVCFLLSLIFLLGNNLSLISTAKTLAINLQIPSVSAQSAILLEADTDEVIYEKNANVRLPMASTTKIMTAIVAMELADPAMMVEISSQAVGIEGSSIYLYAGERLSLEHLLYALLLESANDAATAIAIALCGSVEAFAEQMNQKAAMLGLSNTHFTNPHGLDHQNHYTTARDLAVLADYCMENELFRTIVATRRMTIPLHDEEGARLLLNHNRLLRSYEGTIGLKTGFTKRSGRCLVSAAQRNGVTLIAVTLNAPDDWDDHRGMFDYGFSCYTSLSLLASETYRREIPVIGTFSSTISACNLRDVQVVLPSEHGEITQTCHLPRWTAGNIKQGQVLGYLIWYCDGEVIATEPLVAMTSIDTSPSKTSLWSRFLSLFT